MSEDPDRSREPDREALDAYSSVVTRVAAQVLPSVASLAVRTARGLAGGSASVISADGVLLTSAHVVAGASAAEAALADATGRMIGVNTAVAGIGVGLALPVNATTRGIIATLLAHGRVRRAWIGIVGRQAPLPPTLAAGLGRRTGLHVADVVAGSPAAIAGLHPGDVVVAVDGASVTSTTQIQRLMVEGAIGSRIEITVWRGGALVDVVAEPRELTGV